MKRNTNVQQRCKTAIPTLPRLHSIAPSISDAGDTPRGIFNQIVTNHDPTFMTDFEVNRSLFTKERERPSTAKPKEAKTPRRIRDQPETKTPSKQTPGKPKVVKIQHKQEPQKRLPLSSKKEVAPSTQPTEEEYDELEFVPELTEIRDLTARVQGSYTPDTAFEIIPSLDRILCIVGSLERNYISRICDHPIILDLQDCLFSLIDVDDFLLRTIICRILLCFALDTSSPLLSPISKIFYKLSIDEFNDNYFLEENLDAVLISLIHQAPDDGKVFAVCALENIVGNQTILDRVVKPDFIEYAFLILSTPQSSLPLRVQLISLLRRLTKSPVFISEINDQNLFRKIFIEPEIIGELLKFAVLVPLEIEDRVSLIKKIPVQHEFSQFLPELAAGVENQCVKQLISFIKLEEGSLEVVPLLETISMCNSFEEIEKSGIIQEILESVNSETAVCIAAYDVLQHFEGDQFNEMKEKYAMYTRSNFE